MGSPVLDRNLVILHVTVVVWGLTGILGNLISISSVQLVWYRVLIAALSLAGYFWYKRQSFAVGRREFFQFFLTGGLVGLHWVLFFESIKVSTVSVTLVCLSSATLFTAFIEPLFYHRRTSKIDVFIGIFIIIGICFIFRFESEYIQGIVLGLLAALTAALFGTINSKLVKKNGATIISFYEMLGAWIWVSVFILVGGGFSGDIGIKGRDIGYLVLLGTVCTAGAYVAAVSVMKEISAFRVALASNLEPIYGILLAWLFFGQREVMSAGFYTGALIIFSAVFLYPVLKFRLAKKYAKFRPQA